MKITNMKNLVALSAVVALAGCARVDFYKNPDLTGETGIPIYSPKPYLLVKRTQAEDKPIEVSIEYLPDPENVVYARPKSGFGSADLKLNVVNGQLTSFGQITDTKIPELLDSIAGLATAGAGAKKIIAESDKVRAETRSAAQNAIAPDAETAADIEQLHTDMTKKQASAELNLLFKSDKEVVAGVKDALKTLGDAYQDPGKVAVLPQFSEALVTAAKKFIALSPSADAFGNRAAALGHANDFKARLQAIVAKLQPESAAAESAAEQPDDFELYEILKDGALRRVK